MKRKFVKVMFFGALALSTVTYVGCKDYDDDIDNLQTQIDANKASIADLQAKVNDGKWVKDVVKIEGGFKITFNNGDAYDIVNGKNGAQVDRNTKSHQFQHRVICHQHPQGLLDHQDRQDQQDLVDQ